MLIRGRRLLERGACFYLSVIGAALITGWRLFEYQHLLEKYVIPKITPAKKKKVIQEKVSLVQSFFSGGVTLVIRIQTNSLKQEFRVG